MSGFCGKIVERISLVFWWALPVFGMVGTFPLPGRAEDPARMRDVMLTMRARQALFEDPLLGPLNLGVRVQNRVAVLWGPVPSPELAHQADSVLKQLVELVEVRNQLYLQETDPRRTLPTTVPQKFIPASPLQPGNPTLPGLFPNLRLSPLPSEFLSPRKTLG